MYVENIQSINLALPATGSEAAPVTGDISTYGSTILAIWLHCGTNITTYVKITDRESSFVPVTGYILVPAGITTMLTMERKIEGPPWVLEVWAYNTGGAPAALTVIVKSGDVREVDTSSKILEEVQRVRELLERQILGVVTKRMEV
jgi:hypothetical protein